MKKPRLLVLSAVVALAPPNDSVPATALLQSVGGVQGGVDADPTAAILELAHGRRDSVAIEFDGSSFELKRSIRGKVVFIEVTATRPTYPRKTAVTEGPKRPSPIF